MTRIGRLLLALGLFAPLVALAAAGTQPQNPLGGGLLIAWAIAHFSRRRPIGGWLLYCYIQMYLSLLISLIFTPQIADNLNPSGWDSSFRYVMFFLSTVPVILAELFEVYAATRLLIQRTETNLRVVQRAMLALVVTGAISFGLDATYFQNAVTITFDTLTLIFAVIWAIYFQKAQRVRKVFVEHSWDGTQYKRTPEEKSYLRKRTLWWSAGTFVAFLVLMGASLGDKKPDAHILLVSIFSAVIAALIAWYAPIRKKKRTPEEKRYLRKRTLWWSAGTFVAFLVLMGASLGDNKPDANIFFVPISWAVIAALIAWYAPIRKKKLADLGVTLPDSPQ